jgi:hypothetical protein
MRDITKFDLTIGKSTQTLLTKRALAYEVFAEAMKRGVSPERLRTFLPARQLADVEGSLVEHEFIQRAEKGSPTLSHTLDDESGVADYDRWSVITRGSSTPRRRPAG